ncbi:MAG: carboxymuconolactone decarboxylase family protein [Polyangiaceae bacterium]|nr:carboxymuconolactone decarboxylase family protein [Polyangiaceae bacterium]
MRLSGAERGVFAWASRLGNRLFGRSETPNIMLALSGNQRLFWPWLAFASRFMPFGQLPHRTRERLILRTAWNCRCEYEWGQHADLGQRWGVDQAELSKIAKGPEAAWSALERAQLLAADELHRDRCVSAGTWQALREHHTDAELIELLLLVGHYQMLAGFLNSAGVQLEDRLRKRLEQRATASA